MRWAPWVGLCCLAAAAGFSWLHAYGAIPHADLGAAPRTVVVIGGRQSDLLGAAGSRRTPSAPHGPSTAHARGGAPALGPGSTPIVIPRLPPTAAGTPAPGAPRVSPGKPQPAPGAGTKKPKPPTKPKPHPSPTPTPTPAPTPAPPGTPTPGPTTPPSGGAGGPTASPPPSTPSEPVRTPADNPPPVPTPPCPSAPVTNASVAFAGGLATASFTVAAGCSSIPVSLVSYSLSSPGTAFATTTGTFAAGGPFTLTVHVPACGFGATLLVSGHALTSAAGGAACPPPPPPPPPHPPHSGCDDNSLHPDLHPCDPASTPAGADQ